VTENAVNSITLKKLSPNTQYIIYVTGTNEKGESSPSETLIAWTDPAHSPFVEVRDIIKTILFNYTVQGIKRKWSLTYLLSLSDPCSMCVYVFVFTINIW